MQRQRILSDLARGDATFDVVVVGGGITGAGVAREAAGSGLRTLLVEQRDFAWGTSSRSSKMVHGGLRYLGRGHPGLTREALRERERLLAEAPGLVERLPFIMPHRQGRFPGPRLFQLLLRIYDRMAGVRTRRWLPSHEARTWVPGLGGSDLRGASLFLDAVTDDARLVLRVLEEARRDGALCLNYVRAESVRRDDGRVSGLVLRDQESDRSFTVHTPRVINASGAWACDLQRDPAKVRLRPLRGSHLVLPWSRLPVSCAVSLLHPRDRRPVFAFPWSGMTVLGTTDLDHTPPLNQEPGITPEEVHYLLAIAEELFPGTRLSHQDIVSTWAGVRPVVTDGQGRRPPSGESREHVMWQDAGLVTIAGGKLTTFRTMARQALIAALGPDQAGRLRPESQPLFRPAAVQPRPAGVSRLTWRRLVGYHGQALDELMAAAEPAPIAGTGTLWAELVWACRREAVVHLDDLLLRRTRLGLVLPDGADALLPDIRRRCQPALGWTDERWQWEVRRYRQIYRAAYRLPDESRNPTHDH